MRVRAFLLLATCSLLAHAANTDDAVASGTITMVTENDVSTSDAGYQGGDNWLALQCSETGCALVPSRLSIATATVSGTGELTLPKLHFDTKAGNNTYEYAWFRRDPALPWLKPGPVATPADVAQGYRQPANGGTMEIALTFPGGTEATLVPLLDRERHSVKLQLRMHGMRQMLADLSTCMEIGRNNYLQWAGDIDADGKPDFLVAYPRENDGSHNILYLSSLARQGQLVSAGATFDTAEAFAGCRDGEWFPP